MAGVHASDTAFAELPTAFEALRQELINAGQPIDLVVKPGGTYGFLLGAAGWWVSFQWQRMAANCLEGSFLGVIKWNGHPQWPGYHVWEPGNRVRTDKYSFGLAALDQPRWLSESDPDLSYTSADLAQEVLTKLIEQPNERRR